MSRFFLLIASLLLLDTCHAASAAEGKVLYEATCIACHGPKAQGAIPGVPDLAKGGRLSKPDAVLVANILNGFQSKGSPMAMPPKGGNPNLTAADVETLLRFMRVLTGASASPVRPVRPVGAAPAPVRATATAIASTTARAPMPVPATAIAPATAAVPTAVSAAAPATATAPDMAAFARGAKAWANTCARCHGMRDPKDLTDIQWKVVATHMRLRAGLDGQQVRDITVFLQGSN